ncbi:hypothetical protein [Flavihumibacter solisilvae]|uniref:Uncharacterized protein n=1 Tax=Flavihumibacter solisilvae TaxID=1349421 RepID=A0A0C1LGU0_9BACT|nr:hypothetical protein [Flavihumibacter solisilvae]KIC94508.1 hypothetical protein OI18_10320 [Flavihumibacter solisilvae]
MKLIFTGLLTVLLSCGGNTLDNHSSKNNLTEIEPKETHYKKILEGLSLEYVLYYRNIKNNTNDPNGWGMPATESAFKADSATYWKSKKEFFKQDLNFAKWLLGFKDDTTNGGLWIMYHNPISAYMAECNLPNISNSRAAIILLENFLNGSGFACYECKYENRPKCNSKKYAEIEAFLAINKEKSIENIRAAWQERKAG